MFGASIRRSCLPLRNRLVAMFPWLSGVTSRLDFGLRHLPQLTRDGWSAPLPPLLKRAFLKGVARDERARVFVETGTYLGDTTWYFRNSFEELHSIEVDPYLFAQAAARFRGDRRIVVHQGDSGDVLPAIVPTLTKKCLYWLDGHYSAGITGAGVSHCPVLKELDSIFTLSNAPFVIVIDDARCFGNDPAYPAVAQVRDHVKVLSRGAASVAVENDMIIIRQTSGAC